MATEPAVEQVDHLQRSSRDNTSVPDTLARWLTEQDDTPDDTPAVTVAAGGDSNGMSSETIPVSVSWPGEPTRHWVMRMAPSTTDVPVFRSYRMDHQYETMRLIARLSDVPVPAVHHLEPTGSLLGAPFFLMDRCEGEVPPDVMPYTFGDNWFGDAAEYDRRRAQESAVGVIAALQDLGFIIERANESLGLVTAARFAEPNFYDVMGVTVTVRPEGDGRMTIRANAIYNNKPIEDPKVYQNFFATLERSLFVAKQ